MNSVTCRRGPVDQPGAVPCGGRALGRTGNLGVGMRDLEETTNTWRMGTVCGTEDAT